MTTYGEPATGIRPAGDERPSVRPSVAVERAIGRTASVHGEGDDPRAFRYRMYGLRFLSDIALPLGPLEIEGEETPDVVFRRAPLGQGPPPPDGPMIEEFVCDLPCHQGAVITRVHRGPGGIWIWNLDIGTCHVDPAARVVDVYPDVLAPDEALGVLLSTQISVFVLHQLGWPVLHASAVATEHGTVAFMGPKGQGKSTMALSFVQRGAVLLTDDVTPLMLRPDGVYAVPSYPSIRIWPETAEQALGTQHSLPDLLPGADKKIFQASRHQFARAPARLRRLFLLDPYSNRDPGNGVTVDSLSPQESLVAVLAQVPYGSFLQTREAGRFLPLYARLVKAVPVLRLRFPHGFEYQESVYAHILGDLAAPPAPAVAGSIS